MNTIRRRLTIWYTLALGVTLLAFAALVYFERRRSSIPDLDNHLVREADLAEHWLSESYRVLGSVTTRTDSVSALAPGVSTYFESFRDYTIVSDTGGQVLALSDTTRRLDATALQRLRSLYDSIGNSRRAGTVVLEGPVGPVRYLALRVHSAGPEVGGVILAVRTAEAALGSAELLRSMLFIAPLVLATAAGMSTLLARTSLRPLLGVADELEAITDGRSLHRRLAVPSSGDELGRLMLAINGMLARLEQSFASLHRFTADASHELKTPLMVLRAGVERALTHPGVPPEILQALDDTLAQINQMSEMVESLLTLARADEGRAPLAVEPCDLRELLADVTETAGILGDEVGIVVVAQFPDHPVWLPVDRHRIREMLLNLVTNAVKYTPSGGTVGLTLADNENAVTLTVRDTGIGIAPGDLSHIFDRFWRADPARSRTGERPGTGLGLAITKWIAEAHGGGITVQSRPGRGTVFTVTLPKPPVTVPVAIEAPK